MRTITIDIPDDIHDHAAHVARLRHGSTEEYLADVLIAAVRREVLSEIDRDMPVAGEDAGGNLRIDHGDERRSRRSRGW
jgi:hypothetical protein